MTLNDSYAVIIFRLACSEPIALGLQSGAILDAQITSSSEHSNGLNNAKFARLNQTAVTDVTNGGWVPKSNDLSNPWLQIDFRVTMVFDI
jgi:hypothetical protein